MNSTRNAYQAARSPEQRTMVRSTFVQRLFKVTLFKVCSRFVQGLFKVFFKVCSRFVQGLLKVCLFDSQNNKIFMIIKHGWHIFREISEVRKGMWAFFVLIAFNGC